MQRKGKLTKKSNIRTLTPDERSESAQKRVSDKLGNGEYEKLKNQFKTLVAQSPKSNRSLIDGMIMGLVQQNLSNREIKQVFRVGNNRIDRVRVLIENPELLNKPRPTPKHAATPEDIDRLKAHLGKYDTEDGFPCAHRRPLKFFLKQGLT